MLHRLPTPNFSVIAAFFLLLSSGCGESKTLIEVAGTATHAGKPLSNVTLHFSDPSGWESCGDTDGEGHFTLRIMSTTPTLEVHTCKVWVSSPPSAKEDKDDNVIAKPKKNPKLQNVMRKYGSATSSPKTIEIKESEMKVELD
jgi:hypothetical protein